MLSDEECRASGWGNDNNGQHWDYFWGDFPTFVDLDNQICAGHKDENGYYDANHGTSMGDEGAPLICVIDRQPVIFGTAVVPSLNALHFPNFPNLFTSVSKHVDWIQQVMEN